VKAQMRRKYLTIATYIVLQQCVHRLHERVSSGGRDLLKPAEGANLVLGILTRLQFKGHLDVRRLELGGELLLGACAV
jgi:hypothetical protein